MKRRLTDGEYGRPPRKVVALLVPEDTFQDTDKAADEPENVVS